MQTFQAKVQVAKVVQGSGYESVTFYPVYSPDRADPNYSYSQATPGGDIRLNISNPNLVGKIKEGQVYLVDFTDISNQETKLPEGLPPKPEPDQQHRSEGEEKAPEDMPQNKPVDYRRSDAMP